MLVRPEKPEDHAEIADLIRAAFAGHPYSKGTECALVEGLRRSGGLLVSLVAEEQGRVLGHIAFSWVRIGEVENWVGMGPLAVLPPAQRRGIGKALVEAGLDAVRALGADGCVLVGEPAYYGRFGFRSRDGLGVAGVPPEYVLVLPLGRDLPAGEIVFHPAFAACG